MNGEAVLGDAKADEKAGLGLHQSENQPRNMFIRKQSS